MEDLIRYDVKHGLTYAQCKDKWAVSLTMLWLNRSVQLFGRIQYWLMHETYYKKPNTYDAVSSAYKDTLYLYHGWMLQNVFLAVMRFCPTRKKFLSGLSDGCSLEQCEEEMSSCYETCSYSTTILEDNFIALGENDPVKF